jgi:hypothetical protein
MTRGVHGPIWYKNPEAYHLRTREGWTASRHAVGPRAAQKQSTGRRREKTFVNRKRQNTACSATSRIAPNTTSRHWQKADVDRLDRISTSQPIRFTREDVRNGQGDARQQPKREREEATKGDVKEKEKDKDKDKENAKEKENERNGGHHIATPIESTCQIS